MTLRPLLVSLGVFVFLCNKSSWLIVPMSVAWDTGTTLAYVPPSVMEALAEELGAERAESISSSSSGDYYTVPWYVAPLSSNLPFALELTPFSALRSTRV